MSSSELSSQTEVQVSEQARRRNESEEERLDRNLMELLQELRVVLAGIQFLFAFLLIVPFSDGWDGVTKFETGVYYVTLLLTATSSVLLIAPTVRHRMRFRELDKRWIVETSNRLAIAGIVFLGGAMCGTLVLISNFLYSGALAIVVATLLGLAITWLWFAAPVLRSVRDDE